MSGPCTTSPPPAAPRASPPRGPGRLSAALRVGGRGVLAAVFLMAAVAKITDPESFADQVLLHWPLPPALGNVVVAVLPWLELTCGLCLAFGYAVREAAVLVAVLLLAFVVYTLLTPAEHDCGCLVLPPLRPIGRGSHLAGDLFLLLCCIPVLVGWVSDASEKRLAQHASAKRR